MKTIYDEHILNKIPITVSSLNQILNIEKLDIAKSIKVKSQFDSSIYLEVENAEPMQVIQSIQLAKKSLLQNEVFLNNEVLSVFIKMRKLILENAEYIAKLESHYEGTSWNFQLENSVDPIIHILDFLIKSYESNQFENIHETGVLSFLTPRVSSFYETSWRILFSLFHKNVCLIKVAQVSVVTGIIWSEIIKMAEIPLGVIQFIHGEGNLIGSLLSNHPGINGVSFSGDFKTAQTILKENISINKKLQFFMNGKNATVVLPDFDFKNNMHLIIKPFMDMQGRYALSPSRIYILESMEVEFKKMLVEYLSAINTRTSIDQVTAFTEIQSADKLKFDKMIKELQDEQGKILFKNENFCFLSDLPNCSSYFQENLELPIFTVTTVKYQHELSKWINNTSFGHSLTIWGSPEKAKKIFSKCHVGLILLNPTKYANQFFTAQKQSSFGLTDFSLPNLFYSNVQKIN